MTQQTIERPAVDTTRIERTPKARCSPWSQRARLGVRWSRFAVTSLVSGNPDFSFNAVRALGALGALTLGDLAPGSGRRACNVCGWQGRRFYPNTGPGYDERDTVCPGCGCLDRHRTLLAALAMNSPIFSEPSVMVEVAPNRALHEVYRSANGLDYTSFDIERFAMEKGDLLDMRFEAGSIDLFLAFHVLEHITEEQRAFDEIARVLRPGGVLVMQVPVDWSVEKTYEYDKPDPREVGHVRRYGQDLVEHIGRRGFDADLFRIADHLPVEQIERFGLGTEPIVFAKPGAHGS